MQKVLPAVTIFILGVSISAIILLGSSFDWRLLIIPAFLSLVFFIPFHKEGDQRYYNDGIRLSGRKGGRSSRETTFDEYDDEEE